jgi:peptidoglycan-N-acetylmuramic acid deacetylase
MSRTHPGAIILLHNTSATNGEIMEELLTKWEAEGYEFGVLDDLI